MAAENVTPMSASAEERLERGELLYYPAAPFALPEGDDHAFLLTQQQGGLTHKNISYDPANGRVTGFARQGPASAEQEERLRRIFAVFSGRVTAWLREALARYASACEPDRASFRPFEEATRRLRPTARNDRLHIDAFPTRPARDRRILRVFVNINPTEPRVWAISDSLGKFLARYGAEAGLTGPGWLGVLELLRPVAARRTAADVFMLRFHDFLKLNDELQERAPRRLWTFPPGSAWLAMTDGCIHAELRGRFALEHSYFVGPQVLALPDQSPAALLAACGRQGKAA